MSPVRMGEQSSTGKTNSNGVGTTIGSPLGVVHHCDTRHYRLPTRKTFLGNAPLGDMAATPRVERPGDRPSIATAEFGVRFFFAN